VDAIICATDIGAEHVQRCRPFIEAGLPIFIDKPLSDNEEDLRTVVKWNDEGAHIMSGSSLRYKKEIEIYYDRHNYEGCPELYQRDFSLLRGYVRGSCVNYVRQAAGFLGEHGCRCNALAFAPMAGKQPQAFEDAFVAHNQIKRLATAEDIAAAVTFLASDASAYITGITLPVDGGYTAK